MSLRWRIAIGLGAIAAVVAAVAASGAYLATEARIRDEVDRTLRERATPLVERRPTRGFDRRRRQEIEGLEACVRLGSIPGADAVQLVSRDGRVVQCSDAGPLPVDELDRQIAEGPANPVDPASERTLTEQIRTAEAEGETWRVLTIAMPGGGALQTARNLDESQRVLSGLGLRLLLISIAAVVAAVAMGVVLARRIVGPIERLRDSARRIAETGDLGTPVPVAGDGEVGSLADSFTRMVAALAASRTQQQRLISDAGHEMRTPLTSLRTNVELLQRASNLPEDQQRAILDDIRFETEELTSMMTELVELTGDSADRRASFASVDLVEVATAVAGRARRRSGRTVEVTSATGMATPALGDAAQLERVVANLVDNALKYSPAGSPVTIQIDGTTVTVLDHGDGIAEEDRERIFDRFYRADSARSAPGSGLGLAIVDRIVGEHHGSVFATNRPERGAAVGFTLPSAPVTSAQDGARPAPR